MKLFIVIPVFNGWEQTERCLRSIERSSFEHVTIVVDHGSTDGTTLQLPQRFPEVIHIVETDRLWWTGASNVGIRYALKAGATHISLLNNDCELEEDALAALAAHATETTDAVIAPIQRSIESGRILSAGATPCLVLGFPTLIEARSTANKSGPLIRVRLIMGGRGVLIPRTVFDRVGLLDEETLPHYLSDHDFYFRCRSAGIPLYVAADAAVLVDETRTSLAADLSALTWHEFRDGFSNTRSHRNVVALSSFFRKHYPVRPLWRLGVALNLLRYGTFWLSARTVMLAKRLLRREGPNNRL